MPLIYATLGVALHNCRKCQSFGRKGQMTIPKATTEIGIVLYPGVQAASVHGFTDLFGIAGKMALNGNPDPRSPPRVTHWQAAHRGDANLSCVYDSDPRGSPKPQILIIPPTMVNLPNPDVPPGIVSWLRRQHARGAKLVSVCRAPSSSLKRVSPPGAGFPHTASARRRWRSGFRKSRSTPISALSTMATSSRPGDLGLGRCRPVSRGPNFWQCRQGRNRSLYSV